MNIFQINSSDVEDRFDPKYILYLQNMHSFKYEVFSLKKFLIEKPQYGTAEIGIPRTSFQQPRYIRITDINDFGELDDSLGATAENCPNEYFLYKNDFLFARSGTVGKTYLHKSLSYPSFFAGYMIRVRVDETRLLPDYLFAYTQTGFYKNWVVAIQRAAVQSNINAREYASLPIPLPPLSVQKNIVDLYTDAQNQRKRKLEESEKLLESVDDYLLSELGIELPQKDNSLKNRIFISCFHNVTGGRIDSFANTPVLGKLRSNLNNLSFIYLKDVVTESKLIETELSSSDTYIGLENIESNTGNYIKTDEKETISSALHFEKGQILFPKLRPYLNKVHLAEFNGLCSTEFHVFNAKKMDTKFLYYCLLSRITLEQTSNLMTGNTLPRLQSSDISHILIPNPPFEKQKEIVKHIQQIRNRAKQLKNEADIILQEAKRKVEKMILGEN